METFVILFKFTSQGIKNIKESPKRVETGKELFKAKGMNVKAMYALLGKYDTMLLVEAPNAQILAEVILKIGSEGNVQSQTMRAFSEEEFRKLVQDI